jgi:hypothetical protein
MRFPRRKWRAAWLAGARGAAYNKGARRAILNTDE